MAQGHIWRFFRSGGFDQVQLDQVGDWQHLHELDPKLWAVLSCPAQGLEFDARTLQLLDSDNDGRIRLPEVLAAVAWCNSVLADKSVLLQGEALPLSAIDRNHDEGQKIAESAAQLLRNLKVDGGNVSVDLFADPAKVFPPAQHNGDGFISQALCNTDGARQAWKSVADLYGSHIDRSGEAGIDEAAITQCRSDAQARLDWLQQRTASIPVKLSSSIDDAVAAFQTIVDKLNDYFSRCRLAAFDTRATQLLSPTESDWQAIAKSLIGSDVAAARDFPLAAISAGNALNFEASNPAWTSALNSFRAAVVIPLLGDKKQLSLVEWQQIKETMSAHLAWRGSEPQSPLKALTESDLQTIVGHSDELLQLVQADLAVAEQANTVVAVERLVRYQKYLRVLLQNFVSLAQFYQRKQKAIFQSGELFIDGKNSELCLRVNDVAKHAAMAGLSGCYLLYCDCSRRGSSEKMQIVAAMTGGSAGNIMVGRNGVFFDRKGQDWDATVSRVVDNPISVPDAFWTPYRRIAKLINDQAQKFASDKEKAVQEQSVAQVSQSAQHLEKAAADKAEKPAPFDVAKFAGIFAAIGLAIGAIGTALAALVAGFLSLLWWQMPLALAGVLLLISGPSMLIAYFKLRQRNLAPLLDANGWAVNTKAKITIAFGSALTHSAHLPDGAQRSLQDPYAEKETPWPLWIGLTMLALALVLLWRQGRLQEWLGM